MTMRMSVADHEDRWWIVQQPELRLWSRTQQMDPDDEGEGWCRGGRVGLVGGRPRWALVAGGR